LQLAYVCVIYIYIYTHGKSHQLKRSCVFYVVVFSLWAGTRALQRKCHTPRKVFKSIAFLQHVRLASSISLRNSRAPSIMPWGWGGDGREQRHSMAIKHATQRCGLACGLRQKHLSHWKELRRKSMQAQHACGLPTRKSHKQEDAFATFAVETCFVNMSVYMCVYIYIYV